MKKIALAVALSALFGFAVISYAEESDIPQVEVRPDVATYIIDTLKIQAITTTATVTYRKVSSDGAYIDEFDVTFMNVADNPETPEDETSNKFTQFINYIQTQIGAGDSLKLAVTKACKIELGIE